MASRLAYTCPRKRRRLTERGRHTSSVTRVKPLGRKPKYFQWAPVSAVYPLGTHCREPIEKIADHAVG
jgi:hypothetical protein